MANGHGGARPRTGVKKGVKRQTQLTFQPGELEQIKKQALNIPEAKRLKNQIADYATVVGLLASQYLPAKGPDDKPLRGEDGLLLWPDVAFDRYIKLMTLHGYLAGKGAPFQDPVFAAVRVVVDPPHMPGDDAQIVNLKIFEDTGTAAGIKEGIRQTQLTEVDDGRD